MAASVVLLPPPVPCPPGSITASSGSAKAVTSSEEAEVEMLPPPVPCPGGSITVSGSLIGSLDMMFLLAMVVSEVGRKISAELFVVNLNVRSHQVPVEKICAPFLLELRKNLFGLGQLLLRRGAVA